MHETQPHTCIYTYICIYAYALTLQQKCTTVFMMKGFPTFHHYVVRKEFNRLMIRISGTDGIGLAHGSGAISQQHDVKGIIPRVNLQVQCYRRRAACLHKIKLQPCNISSSVRTTNRHSHTKTKGEESWSRTGGQSGKPACGKTEGPLLSQRSLWLLEKILPNTRYLAPSQPPTPLQGKKREGG